jgi:POT family proton-dependent oligopeptide transporter
MSAADSNDNFVPPPAGSFLGHPKALWNLFGTEFWERFMYYGMRAMLAVHVAAQFFGHLGVDAEAEASKTYGGFTSMVYMTGILGGYVADRILGYQRSIMLGGVLMAVGMFMLMTPSLTMFLLGLAVLILGNGLFKPNISTMVGKLYAPGDARRDSGFTIFYMGINAGALIAPIICATWIGANYGYEWGFLTAGIGMIFGLMMFQIFKGWLGHVGVTPAGKEGVGPLAQVLVGVLVLVGPVYLLLSQSDLLGVLMCVLLVALVAYFVWSGIQSGQKEQLHRYIAMLILFLANICFWMLFEQAGSSLNFLARDYIQMPTIFGYTLHFTIFQSVNPIFILLLAPIFSALWPALDNKNINPSIPRKFAIGLAGVAVGFYLLVFAIRNFVGDDGYLSWIWLTLMYMIHTMGELCLSPIGLAMITKLARPEETGLAMGGWFLSIAVALYLAGRIAAIAAGGGGGHGEETASSLTQYGDVFQQLAIFGLIVAAIYFVLAPLINKLMHGVK